MSRIHALDIQTANSIAAGEVVERPASVVKELVENALDAAATVIHVTIRQGGIRLIRVSDNGCGMDKEDALLAFGRHTTSKLSRIEDLDQLATMGFRGEALASIAAVAKVRLETREPGSEQGFSLQIHGGEQQMAGPAGCAEGTTVTVEQLFYNVPARFKFLRKDSTEAQVITDMILRLGLARPDVSFRLLHNDQEILHTPGNNDLGSTLYALFGRQVAAGCLPVDHQQTPLHVHGQAGRPELARSSRSQQIFYVNGRVIRSRLLTAALDEAYKTLLMKGKYAFAVLFVELPPHLVDVNVHPQKMEVRFWNDREVFRTVFHAVKEALAKDAGILEDSMTQKENMQKEDHSGKEQPSPATSQEITGRQVELKPAAEEQEYKQKQRQPDTQPNQPPQKTRTNTQEMTAGSYASESEAAGHRVADEASSPVLKVDVLGQARYIGQLFQTYLLFEYAGEFLLIDQHAAHEKVLFESLLAKQRSHKDQPDAWSQQLLVPQTIPVSVREMQAVQSEGEKLRQLGFDFEPFGSQEILVRSQPEGQRDQALQTEPAFRLALDALLNDDLESEEQIADLYYRMACKAAVKAHDTLKDEEVSQLLKDLQQLDNPYQCPHGRPVMIRISRQELEKRFKRIV